MGLEHHKGVSDLEEQNAVELMRYVTPYSTSLDVLKDVSAFAPALHKDELRFFSFVDTWASGPPGKGLWQNEAQTQCQAVQPIGDGSQRNGFMLHAELLYWPDKEAQGRVTKVIRTDVRPDPFGQPLLMGQHEVVKVQKQAASPASLLELGGALGHVLEGTALRDGEQAKAYACSSPRDVVQQLRRAVGEEQYAQGLGAAFVELQEKHGQWD